MPPSSSRAAACRRSELEPRRGRNGPAYGPKFRSTAATAQTSRRTPPCGRPRPRSSSWSPGRTAGPDGWRLVVAQRFSNLGWGTQLRRHTNQLQSRPDSQFRVSTCQVTLEIAPPGCECQPEAGGELWMETPPHALAVQARGQPPAPTPPHPPDLQNPTAGLTQLLNAHPP